MPDLLAQLSAALPSDYHLDTNIGNGGQGTVFRGTFKGCDVAVKAFRPGADDRRISRELDLLRAIECPFLVKVRDATTVSISGTPVSVIAYEYLNGPDLTSRLVSSAPPMMAGDLRDVGVHIGTAMDVLWQRRIVHRDIKPANIISLSDRYVLVDVGLARHLDRSDITALGRTAGTEGYMSPEQAAGRRALTISADVFSLGVTLYQLAALRHPFNGAQTLIGRLSPTPLATERADLPPSLAELIDRMFVLTPHRRPTDFVERLSRLVI